MGQFGDFYLIKKYVKITKLIDETIPSKKTFTQTNKIVEGHSSSKICATFKFYF